jgi:hypothetical protein
VKCKADNIGGSDGNTNGNIRRRVALFNREGMVNDEM